MNKIALGVGEMMQLNFLGVPISDASMRWRREAAGYALEVNYEDEDEDDSVNISGIDCKNDTICAYTLEDILGKIPCVDGVAGWSMCYSRDLGAYICTAWVTDYSVAEVGDTPVAAAYKILLWYAQYHPEYIQVVNA